MIADTMCLSLLGCSAQKLPADSSSTESDLEQTALSIPPEAYDILYAMPENAGPVSHLTAEERAELSAQPVQFQNSTLEECVRRSIRVRNRPLSKLDCFAVTALDFSEYPIDDLEQFQNDFELIPNVKKLNLAYSEIQNLEPLANWAQLEELTVNSSTVVDLSGLSALPKMKRLKISGGNGMDFSTLPELPELQKLTVIGSFSNASFLSKFPKLTHLRLMSDVSFDPAPVAQLSQLQELSIGNNGPISLSFLSGLTELRTLCLLDPIEDFSPVSNLKNLQALLCYGGEGGITDISALSSLTKLNTLDLRNNQISDVSALAGLERLESVNLEGNPIENWID